MTPGFVRRALVGGILCAFGAARGANSQTTATVGAPTPDSLARLVMSRFASATPDAFDSVYVDPLGRHGEPTSSARSGRAPIEPCCC